MSRQTTLHSKALAFVLVSALLCALAMAVVPTAFAATTIYVATTGSDSNDCLSEAAACLTIQAAIDKAADGDTVSVAAGTYDTTATTVVNKPLTLTGPTGGGAILRGTNSALIPVLDISASNVTIQNLEVTHNALPAFSSNPTSYTDFDYSLVRILPSLDLTVTIKDSKIYVPTQAGAMTTWNGIAIMVSASVSLGNDVTITNNTIYNTRNGVVIKNNNDVTLTGNTIYNTKGGIMNYTSNLGEVARRLMSGNTWTTAHNEWDIVWNSGGSYTPVDRVPDVLGVSTANNGAYVLDQRCDGSSSCSSANITSNRSHAFVNATTGTTAKTGANGNINVPYQTIALGVEAVVAGGTVNVAAGTYNGNITLSKPLTLRGANAGIHPAVGTHPTETVGVRGAETIMSNGNALAPSADNITIDGFKFTGTATRIIDTYANANNFHLTNCVFDSSRESGSNGLIQFGGGSHTNVVLDFNLFADTGDHTFYTGGGPYDGLSVAYNKFSSRSNSVFWTATALNNGVIEGNEFDGLSGTRSNTINIGNAGNLIIRDNWFHDNLYTPVQVGLIGGAITGNTFERVSPHSSAGGYAFQLWGGQWGTTVSTNVTIENNKVLYNDVTGATLPVHGLHLRPPDSASIDASTIHVSNNAFLNGGVRGDAKAVRHQGNASTTLDADTNWWGTISGGAIAGWVEGPVDFDPWIATYTDDPGKVGRPGFWPLNVVTVSPCTTDCYVDPAGDDANPGSAAFPFKTIQKGIGAVTTGGTVNVAAGTYVESPNLTRPVQLLGAGSATTVINGTVTVDGSASGVAGTPTLVKGFDINSGTPVNLGNALQYARIEDCKIGGAGNGIRVVSAASVAHLEFVGLTFYGNVIDVYFANETLAGASTADDILFDGCAFSGTGKGIYAEKLSNAVIKNSTFTDVANVNQGYYGQAIDINLKWADYTNITIQDNTLTNSGNSDGTNGVGGSAIGIKARGTGGDSGYASRPATLTNVTVTGNTITGGQRGIRMGEPGKNNTGPTNVQIHYNKFIDIPLTPTGTDAAGAVVNGTTPMTNAENNWWDTACGPLGGDASPVSANVDFSPWGLTPTGVAPTPTPITDGMSASDQCAQINSAASNSTIVYGAGSYPGGVVVGVNGVTIDLNGATVGAGSPAYTIVTDDVTLMNGILDGNGSTSPAVLVNGGADNFTLKDVEVREWADGVQVAGAVESLKIVGNWFHNNTDAGLQVDAAVDGVVTIEGNLFKENTGFGISSAVALEAQYNSWGDPAGAGGPLADGVSATVDASNPTYVEYWIDIKPDDNPAELRLAEGATFNVALKADAKLLNGLTFQITYPTELTLTAAPTFVYPWAGTCAAVTSPVPPADSVAYHCTIINAPLEWNGGTIATFPFQVETLPGSPLNRWFDIAHAAPATSAAAIGGVKVYVNNAGFGAPSVSDRDITDAQDSGKLILGKLAQYKGFIDLQGRSNDSLAKLVVKNQQVKSGSLDLASGTSAAGGGYTTALLGPTQLFQGETYWFQVDRALYLPTTAVASYSSSPIPTDWQHSKLLGSSALQSLATVVLLGGDATNDDVIGTGDAGCIGGKYGQTPAVCGAGGTSDVNEDGKMDILDLTLMGGNYSKTASPATTWVP